MEFYPAINDVLEPAAPDCCIQEPCVLTAVATERKDGLWLPHSKPKDGVAVVRHVAFVLPISRRQMFPALVDWEQMLNEGSTGKLQLVIKEGPVVTIAPTSAAWREAVKRYQYIESLLKDARMRIYQKAGRYKLIEETAASAKEGGISPNTIVAALRDFWLCGSIEGLVPHYELRGKLKAAPPSPCAVPVRKLPQVDGEDQRRSRGRETYSEKSKGIYTFPYLFEGEERARVLAFALKHFDPRKKTQRKLYRMVVREFYTTTVNGAVVQKRPGQRPSYKQLYYAVRTSFTYKDWVKAHTNPADFSNNLEGKTGTVHDVVPCVGHTYSIDATVVDVIVVARSNRLKNLRKPTLYLIVDDFSRLIVGFYLTLDKPSWASAKEALLSVAMDKEKLCKRWGAPYMPEAWPATGKYSLKVVADRGSDMLCGASELLCEGLAISVVNIPSQLAARHGIVEMTFHVTAVELKNETPGRVPPGHEQKRQHEDLTDLPRYTLDELGAELLDIIQTQNLKAMEGYLQEVLDVLDGELPTPVNIWKKDYARSAGHLATLRYDFMRWKLLERTEATVEQEGFRIRTQYFGEKHGQFAEMFIPGYFKNEKKIFAFFERGNPGCIWVRDTNNPHAQPVEVARNSHSERFDGHTWGEIELLETLSERLRGQGKEHNFTLELQLAERARHRRQAAEAAFQQALRDSPDDQSRVDKDGRLYQQEADERRLEVLKDTSSLATREAAYCADASTQASVTTVDAANPAGSTPSTPPRKETVKPIRSPESPESEDDIIKSLMEMQSK